MTWKKSKNDSEWTYKYSLKLETTCSTIKNKKHCGKNVKDVDTNSLYYAATKAKEVISHVYYHVEGNSKLQINAQVPYLKNLSKFN